MHCENRDGFLLIAHRRREVATRLLVVGLVTGCAWAAVYAWPTLAMVALVTLISAVLVVLALRGSRVRVRVRVEGRWLRLTPADAAGRTVDGFEAVALDGLRGLFRATEYEHSLAVSGARRGTLHLADTGTGDLERLMSVLVRNGVPIDRGR